jgi:hypothetical protein
MHGVSSASAHVLCTTCPTFVDFAFKALAVRMGAFYWVVFPRGMGAAAMS